MPGGALFDLNDTKRRVYLHHCSELGEFFFSSDSVIATFTRWGFAKTHPELHSEEENEAFMAISYTIGGMMVFPANRIDRKWTINQAHGCLKKISDRFDLALECGAPDQQRSLQRLKRDELARQAARVGWCRGLRLHARTHRAVVRVRCLHPASGLGERRVAGLRPAI